MKCCKKTLIVAAILGVGVALVAGTSWGTLAKHRAAHWFQKQVPMEAQLEKVKLDISKLDHDIDTGWPHIATYEREIKDLRGDLSNKQEKIAKMEKDLATAADELEKDVKFITYNNQKYSVAAAGKLLNQQANLLSAMKREVASKDKLLNAREQKLASAMARQKEMISQKSRLQADVAQLEADLETLRYAQAESKLPVGDNSRLDSIKEKVRELRAQIEDSKRVIELQNTYNPNLDAAVPAATKETSESREEVIRKVRSAVGEDRNFANKGE